MSGINRRKLITSGVIWPNGLTIDTDESRMFWVDARLDRYALRINIKRFVGG